MPLANDTRGWVMTALSGIACVFGASLICVDIIVRLFPGKSGFRIQDSDVFLSLSLSLSFGVMLFSALYSMLPSSKRSLEAGGFSPKEASWIMIACFLAGVIGIQIISRWLHHHIPHNVVDCEHQHEDEEMLKERPESHVYDHGHDHGSRHANEHDHHHEQQTLREPPSSSLRPQSENGTTLTRPKTLQSRITESLTQLATGKDAHCHDDGPCYGYSDACPPTCFRTISTKASRASLRTTSTPTNGHNRPAATKSVTASESTPLLHEVFKPHTRAAAESSADSHTHFTDLETGPLTASAHSHSHPNHHHDHDHSNNEENSPEHHHHHVPQNAFMSIGFQTSIAIALHKLPEGFITYATNHANPKLGVSVFLALFIHNITEGFAMALPLYLAINNRVKAMLISFVLGGLSQPIGAGVAAVWFAAAGKGKFEPDESVYGGMFAVTAGIMASVALQLFQESLTLAHSKGLCLVGAFAGMTILGISSALTA